MGAYFAQCLKASEAERCPGEEVCSRLGNFPLSKPGAEPDVECPKCERRFTKEGWFEPGVLEGIETLDELSLRRIANRTLELDAVERSGWAARYPVEFTVVDWLALRALTNARAEYEQETMKKQREKTQPPKAHGREAHLAKSMDYIREQQRKRQ